MMDLDMKQIEKFGQIKFGEENSESAHDFEKSLIDYISPETESEYYSKLGSDFTNVKFGEIDNSEIEDFEESFKKHFT